MNKEMKLYIGTKTVKAIPMTMTKAQKMLGREIKPATVEEDGYLVEYKDEYRSWSPKSVFEEAYKPSETFLERLYIERDELNERFTALDSFLDKGYSYVIDKVGALQASLLISQHMCMSGYLNILNSRILDIESTKLK